MSYAVYLVNGEKEIGVGFDRYDDPAPNDDAVQFVRQDDADHWLSLAKGKFSSGKQLIVKKVSARKKKPA